MKQLIIRTVLYVLFLSVVTYLCVKLVLKQKAEWVEGYQKPDTTITIHNGKPDTVIVKKQAPIWLK